MIKEVPNGVRIKWFNIGSIEGTDNPTSYCNGFISQRYDEAFIILFRRDGLIYTAQYTDNSWSKWRHITTTE